MLRQADELVVAGDADIAHAPKAPLLRLRAGDRIIEDVFVKTAGPGNLYRCPPALVPRIIKRRDDVAIECAHFIVCIWLTGRLDLGSTGAQRVLPNVFGAQVHAQPRLDPRTQSV